MLRFIAVGAVLVSAAQDSRFELIGLRVGMSGDAVKATLVSRGYALSDTIVSYSYRQKLVRMVAANRKMPIEDSRTLESYSDLEFHKGAEAVYVAFQQTRSGPTATDFKYTVRGFYVNQSAFKVKALSNYGEPSFERDGKTFWCQAIESKCDVTKGEAVILNLTDSSSVIVTLTGSNDEQLVGSNQLRDDVREKSAIKPDF